jgi:opacity protein-like surface antigen
MRKFPADFLRVVSIFIITLALALTAFAQDFSGNQNKRKNNSNEEKPASSVQTDDAFDRKNELAVWGGFAPDIPRVFGGSRESSFGEIGLRYSRRIATTENLMLKYQIDFIPLAIINYERELLFRPTPTTLGVNRDKTTAYGAGITPVNFQLNFRRRNRIQPFITAEAGMLLFNKSIPDDRSAVRPNQVGRKFNFTLAGGGGVEFLTSDARSYTVGFKFHHISNASTGNINPGFDQNLFYFGYTFKKF